MEDPIEKRLKAMVKQIDEEIKQAKAKIVPAFDLVRRLDSTFLFTIARLLLSHHIESLYL